MRVGVICEGQSDFPAIESFFGHALSEHGIEAKFIPLQPQMDRTRAEASWCHVLFWLRDNPPQARIQNYFGGGLFGGSLGLQPLDALLIQMDADIVSDDGFVSFVRSRYLAEVADSTDAHERADAIRQVIEVAAGLANLTDVDVRRHVVAPAVDSTETWCVAAFVSQPQDFEQLRGADLVNAFMRALERSENREPKENYATCDKTLARRRKFCEVHRASSRRVADGCSQFSRILRDLRDLAIGNNG